MANSTPQRSILVYADWVTLGMPALMGTLTASRVRGKEVFSFAYADAWLASGNLQMLDPDLQAYAGPQFLANEKSNFGFLLDSSPDRWGRVLMDRREALLARTEARRPRTLFETDYLLGVFDRHRMGALRFKDTAGGDFLNSNREMAASPWTSIRELEEASLRLEQEGADDSSELRWLNLLMAPGSSLGGARPKASVMDPDGHLWIAKFPAKNDTKDVGAWEKVAHELAGRAGLRVAEARTGKFYSNQHTFLAKRFDRTARGERLHFASAMTLLGYTDGTDYQAGASYLELAELITRHGAQPDADLEELWRRIVFYICVSNTDDHLRNHGFLLTDRGWALSPAYDINPVEMGTGLALNISETDNALDLDLAREVAPFFRVPDQRAREIITAVVDAVKQWSIVAENLGISKAERGRMARAFGGF